MTLRRMLFSCAFVLCATMPSFTFAQAAKAPISQIQGTIDTSTSVLVAHSKPAAIAHTSDLGEVPSDRPMDHILLVLQASAERQSAAQQYLIDVQNPDSANYHKWLTPSQYGQQFGPSAADQQQIAGWLKSQGFTVNTIAAGGGWIDFSGTVGTVQNAFHTAIHSYSLHGVTHSANNSDISIPAALGNIVSGVVRLNNFVKPAPIRDLGTVTQQKGQPAVITRKSPAVNGTAPQLISQAGNQLVTPGDLQQIYDAGSLNKSGVDGTGVSIAIIGRSNIELADIRAFRQIFNLPASDPQIIINGPDPGISISDQSESSLDLEYAGALAPKAALKFVIAASTSTADGIDLAASYAVDNNIAPIVSVSYGECEAFLATAGNIFYKNLWQQAAAQGISVMVSSDDTGSAGCDGEAGYPAQDGLEVNGLASTAYNTAVGGTMFTQTSLGAPFWNSTNGANFTTANGYVPETAWNESCDPSQPYAAGGNCSLFGGTANAGYLNVAGGGGVSSCITPTIDPSTDAITCSGAYAKPSWQSGPGVPTDGVRDLPDVAFTAAAGTAPYVTCMNGSCQFTPDGSGSYILYSASTVGGTSAATPLFAGMVALLNQKYSGAQGLLNYKLYQLAGMQAAGSCTATSQTDPTNRGTCIFHDITTGSNAVPCLEGTQDCPDTNPGTVGVLPGYSAGPGYDLATGLGSIDAAHLLSAWGNLSLAATTTTFTATPTSTSHGNQVTISGTVSAASGNSVPSGQISLQTSNGGESYGQFTLTAGAFSGVVTNLPGGTYTLHAHYTGDGSFATSDSAAISMTITPESSTTTLATPVGADNNGNYTSTTLYYGFPILMAASVAGASGQGTPTGNVTYTLDGTTSLGTYSLNNMGAVDLYVSPLSTTNFPSIGKHTVATSYSGDSSFNASTTPPTTFTVGKAYTYVEVGGSTQTPTVGQATLLTTIVIFNQYFAQYPTGTVQFYVDQVPVGSPVAVSYSGINAASFKDAQAVLPYTFTTPGQHVLDATYSGDATYISSTTMGTYYSAVLDVAPTSGLPAAVSASSSSVTPVLGQGVVFTINVSPSTSAGSGLVPTGTVTLMGNTPSVAQAANSITLSNGSATLNYVFTQAGKTPLLVSYSGDQNFAPSSSPLITLNVPKATPAATLSASSNLAPPGIQLSFQTLLTTSSNSTALPAPFGAVQLFDSLNGAPGVAVGAAKALTPGNGSFADQSNFVATITVPQLAIGTHSLYTVYIGDANYNAVQTTPVTVIISNPDFSIAGPAAPGIALTAGSSATGTLQLTPLLGFNSAVSLSCDPASVPVGVTCTVSPGSVNGASGTATVTLSTAMPGTVASLERGGLPFALGAAPFLAITGLCFGFSRRRKQTATLLLSALLTAILVSSMGCSSSGPSSTTITLSSSSSKVASGSTVTFVASVTATDGRTPTGAVTFTSDGSALGQAAAIVSGTAKLDNSTLTVGVHTLTANYSGDSKTTSSNSNKYLQAITGSTSVRIIATSGSLSHTVTVPVTLQ